MQAYLPFAAKGATPHALNIAPANLIHKAEGALHE